MLLRPQRRAAGGGGPRRSARRVRPDRGRLAGARPRSSRRGTRRTRSRPAPCSSAARCRPRPAAPAARSSHLRRRRALLRRPRAALVIGPATTAQRVAAAVLRHPRCGVRPVGIVAENPDGADGLPVLTTGQEVQRALIQNGVREVLCVHPAVRSVQGPLLRALAESGCTVWEIDADTPSYASREQLAGFSCRRLDMGAPAPRQPRQTAAGRRGLRDAAAAGEPAAAAVRDRAAADRRARGGVPAGAHRQGRQALHPAEVPHPPPGRRARGGDPLERGAASAR